MEAIKKRRYTGPVKGSSEAKDRMAKVRAAQWAKNGLIMSDKKGDARSGVAGDTQANRGPA